MDPLSLTVSITTLIGTITQLLSYLNDVKNTVKERANLASETASLLPLLFRLKLRAKEAEDTRDTWFESTRTLLSGADGPLDQFRNALVELAGKLAPATGVKVLSRTLTWTLDKRKSIEILAKIERLKTLIGLSLQEDTLQVSRIKSVHTTGILY